MKNLLLKAFVALLAIAAAATVPAKGQSSTGDPASTLYQAALAAIQHNHDYRIQTDVNGTTYYVTTEGLLTSNSQQAGVFHITKTNAADGALVGTGFRIFGAVKPFTNPPLSGNVANLNPGAFSRLTDWDRDTWERQVLYLDGNGKFAIRSCNVPYGESSYNDAGRTFWTYSTGDAVTPCYTYTASFIWDFVEYVPPTLAGDGTEDSPYLISTADDWYTFATSVNCGNSYKGHFLKLTTDISVTTMVGTSANKFKGTFDGGGHTLTVNYNSSENCAAPFSWVSGATIKHLHVAGTITTSGQFAGVVGNVNGGCTIIGCRSSITINSTRNGDGTHGGFVGLIDAGTVCISNSLFDGTFNSTTTTNWGGFIGWGHSFVRSIMTNCLFAPTNTSWDFSTDGSYTFSRNPGQATCTNCYYTKALDENNNNANTIDASSYSNSQLLTALGAGWTISNNKVVPATTLQPLTGNGTYASPYLIASANDWNTLLFNVNTMGETYKGSCFKLTADIAVSEMLGTVGTPFCGVINGDGHTLTFNYGTAENRCTGYYCAPFQYVDGATLMNLHIAGAIYSNGWMAASVIGYVRGTVNIINCRSSVEINSVINGDATDGGMVGLVENGAQLYMTNCLFDGKLTGSNTNHCGGMLGWTNAQQGSSSHFTNCLFAPAEVTMGTTNSATYSRGQNGNADGIYLVNSYYTQAFGTEHGTAVGSMSNSELLAALGNGWTISDNKVVPAISSHTIAGNGTEQSPYLIATAVDWHELALFTNVMFGTNVHFRLTADIAVTEMVGSDANRFCGIFDGDGHTLTVTYNATSDHVGPFCCVEDATVKNLHVAGTINTTMRYAAGIVSACYGNMLIENCRSSVNIVCGYGGDATCGGILGVSHGTTFVTGCIFDGTFARTSSGYNCGGFAGWVDNGTTGTFTDCLFAPASMAEGMLQRTFSRGIQTLIFYNCHYLTLGGEAQGKQALSVTAADGATVAFAGTPTNTYSVSGLTFYGTGLVYNDGLYAAEGDAVSLTLGFSDPNTNAEKYYFAASTGTLAGTANPYTLTPAAADCQISAVPKPTVRMADGTEDAEHWTIAPAEATTVGLLPGSTVTATYTGDRKVKSVKAVKVVPPTITIDDLVLNGQDGDSWETIVANNPDKIEITGGFVSRLPGGENLMDGECGGGSTNPVSSSSTYNASWANGYHWCGD